MGVDAQGRLVEHFMGVGVAVAVVHLRLWRDRQELVRLSQQVGLRAGQTRPVREYHGCGARIEKPVGVD